MRTLRPRVNSPRLEQSLSPEDEVSNGSISPLPTPKRLGGDRAPRKSKNEWEWIKPHFKRLYGDEDLSLKEVMEQLKADHGFLATENQFKAKLKKWGIEKKAKTSEMQHIIKIQNRRRRQNPSKRTKFRIRHKHVEEAKIERFKREHRELSTPSSSTPSAISWRSPSPDFPVTIDNRESGYYGENSGFLGQPEMDTHGISFESTGSDSTFSHESSASRYNQGGQIFPPLSPYLAALGQSGCSTDQQGNLMPAEVTRGPMSDVYESGSTRQRTSSIPLQDYELFSRWRAFNTQQDSSEPNSSPALEALQGLVIGETSWGEVVFNRKKSYEFEHLKSQARLQGLKVDYVSGSKEGCECLFCRILGLMDFFRACTKAHATKQLALSFTPDWRWCLSEACKMILLRRKQCNLKLLVLLTLICHSEGLVEARDFCRAAVQEFRSIKDPSLEQKDLALNLVAFLLFMKHLPEAEGLLKDVMHSCFEMLQDFDFLDGFPTDLSNVEEQQAMLVHRRAGCLLRSIRYFEWYFSTAHGVLPQNQATEDEFARYTKMTLSDFAFAFSGNRKLYREYILTRNNLEPYGDSRSLFAKPPTRSDEFCAAGWINFWRFMSTNAVFLGVFSGTRDTG